MRPLSPVLIAVLANVSKHGATRVEIGRSIELFVGDASVANNALPAAALDALRDELRALGAQATPTRIAVRTPTGPLKFYAAVTATKATLAFKS